MKHIIGIILIFLVGTIIGFFGVLISVFADSALSERLITIFIILVIYGMLGTLWGYLLPKYSWKWGLILGLPGVYFLGWYMTNEFNLYHILYMILIIAISCLGAYMGSRIKSRKK